MKVRATAILHPAAIMRGAWALGPAQAAAVGRVIDNPQVEVVDVTKPPPGSVLYPSLSQVLTFVGEVMDKGAVSIDLENAGRYVICVGMTAFQLDPLELGTTLCLRFRTQYGQRYWSNMQDHLHAVHALAKLLSSTVTKVFHNGVTYDVPLLLEHGFEVNPPYLDTLVMQNLAYSEMSRGLGFCANLYLGAPRWKWLVHQDSESEGKA